MKVVKRHWPKIFLLILASPLLIYACTVLAETLPPLGGTKDGITKLTAAGSLLRIVDSFMFSFGARLMAGLAVLGAGWHLKEQRFALAIICIIAAIMMGTVPMWIKNIFEMDGSGGTIFNLGD